MKSHTNLGRNVINIEQLKEALFHYAERKKLSRELTLWLQKNFLKWLINHFPHVQVVQSEERYRTLVRGRVPHWFQPEKKNVEFIYIDMAHPTLQEILDNSTEFLMTRNEKMRHKFPRMSVEQVLKKWEDEHKRMAQRTRRYKETTSEGLEKIFSFGSLDFVKFDPTHPELSLEMAKESIVMQHCLGEFENSELGEGGYGEYYIKLIRDREIFLYSLRDEKNLPHVTIALYESDGVLWLDQIKGKQNASPVERYVEASVALFNFLDVHYNYHNDTLGMGVVFIEGKSRRIKEIKEERIQQFLVAYRASFIYDLPNPSKATYWLAILSEPKLVEHLDGATDSMKISALLQHSLLMLKVKFELPTTPKEVLKSVQRYQIKERIFRFVKLQIGRV